MEGLGGLDVAENFSFNEDNDDEKTRKICPPDYLKGSG